MDREYLIKKWLSEELTEEENQAFMALDEYDTHLSVLEGAQAFKASEVSGDIDFEAILKDVQKSKLSKVRRIRDYNPLLKIAASVIVVVGLLSLFFLPLDTVVRTGIGEKATIELPDASEVEINSKSFIRYSKKKWKKDRVVNLTGEAFFKVSKGSKFDVVTQFGKISVLGTQFNVKSREDYFEVACLEGLVLVAQVNQPDINLKAGNAIKIVKGQVYFEENSQSSLNWMNNVSTFKSEPFGEVLKELERQYEVTFALDNIDVNRIFTGGFVHNNLQDALKSITLPLDLNFRVDESNHITFHKRKK
ncbi:FecR family protein [Aquimarina pacifica]|uniref:FecR family protein n=1 Tax=Aquimarina pacifica TaxID=1296415 RepID=UPI0004715B0B|nr:FecR family protein [Aquimarina pacifica]